MLMLKVLGSGVGGLGSSSQGSTPAVLCPLSNFCFLLTSVYTTEWFSFIVEKIGKLLILLIRAPLKKLFEEHEEKIGTICLFNMGRL